MSDQRLRARKKSQSKVTHCTAIIEPLNKSSPQPRRGELGSRSYSVYGHLKPTTSPRLQNYMSLLFTLPLELDWTEFLPLALNSWRFGIITLIASLVLTLISHSKSCSFLRRLKCHLLYMFLTLFVCVYTPLWKLFQDWARLTTFRSPEKPLPTWHFKDLAVQRCWHFAWEFLCISCLPIISFHILLMCLSMSTNLNFFYSSTISDFPLPYQFLPLPQPWLFSDRNPKTLPHLSPGNNAIYN